MIHLDPFQLLAAIGALLAFLALNKDDFDVHHYNKPERDEIKNNSN